MVRGRHLSTIKSGKEFQSASRSFDDRDSLSESHPPDTFEHRRTNSYPPPSYFDSPPPPSRPLGFGIVAQARRLEYKERSQRRLMGGNKQTSLRHLFSPTERPLNETSPLVSSKTEMTKQEDGVDVAELIKEETVAEALVDIVFGQWVSMLLIFSPLALASHFLEWDPKYTFWLWCVSQVNPVFKSALCVL